MLTVIQDCYEQFGNGSERERARLWEEIEVRIKRLRELEEDG
jgi:hypothetical protein